MRIAILSDIHGNLPALEAVLKDIEASGGADMYWSLGDIVGYGPFPNESIETLKKYPHISLPGNHDYGVIDSTILEDFNSDARRACAWSREQLTPENLAYLQNLPEILRLAGDATGGFHPVEAKTPAQITLVHGSPRDYIWEYLLDARQAAQSFKVLDTPYCFIGHSHIPLIFAEVPVEAKDGEAKNVIGTAHPDAGDTIELGEHRLIINPGSVGQPRDGDPRAAYALYDVDNSTVEFRRVPYEIERTQKAITDAGLPIRLAMRLSSGL